MEWQLLGEWDGTRDYTLVFETGDSVMDGLERFARDEDVRAASFFALGALRSATLAFFATDTRAYEDISVEEQVEVVSFSGNVGREDGEPRLHVHCVLGRRDGSTVAGHMQDGVVRPTLEVFLRAHDTTLERVPDQESGLALIRPRETSEPDGS